MKELAEFIGTWHIYEMELWDEDYFNMEMQAFIEIDEKGDGEFQFGLVRGSFFIDEIGGDGRMGFDWNGSDENEEAFGSGWVELNDENTLNGSIKFHQGDKSKFLAKRVNKL
jgi:hypothetical protein